MRPEHSFPARTVAALLVTAFLASGCAGLRKPESTPANSREQAQIEQRIHEICAACESKDFDRLDSYHFYGPKFTRFAASSPVRMDAAAGRKCEHDGLSAAKGLKMGVE